MLAQFVLDAAVALLRTLALKDRLGDLALPLLWTFAVDSILAPIGLMAVSSTTSSYSAAALAMLPVGLIALLAQDRRELAQTKTALGEAILTAQHEARIDPLTGLANRRAWYEAMVQSVDRRESGSSAKFMAVIVTDINGLKRVNDTQGHEAGDQLIQSMAELLKSIAPPHAVVGAELYVDKHAYRQEQDRR